jgi:hypothetical protein
MFKEELMLPRRFKLTVVDKRLKIPMVTGCVNTEVTEDSNHLEYNTV